MGRYFIIRVFFILASCLMPSCKKEEGTGGRSTITGKVIVRQYNTNFTYLVEQYPATDEEVFVIYGDDPVYGDKTSTHYDGTYRFEYLQEGVYTVFAYSDDSANYPTDHKIPVIKRVSVGKGQSVQVEDIYILK